MIRYLHRFQTEAEFNQERSENYLEPWVSLTGENDRVDYNKTEDEKLLGMPFTIEALGSGSISWNLKDKSLQYSKNGGVWTTMDSATTITVVQGDEIQFKGTNSSYCVDGGLDFYPVISSTASFNAKGNIMSLTDGDNFLTANTVSESAFTCLFEGSPIVSAGKLKLPAMTLGDYCYDSMFSGCTSLATAPELPATALTDYCYISIFEGCTSLTATPELPAITLAEGCYNGMFRECTSLTTAPELPATTLATDCYFYMFYGCTSLTTAPELPATTLASNCYGHMFERCTNLNYIKAMFTTTPGYSYTNSWVFRVAAAGTFVKNSEAQWTTTGDNAVPTGWTVQTASS